MVDVACFCGCCYSFDGGAGPCPRCGEVASILPEPARLGFVTGASSGIGEAFACRLAADGWNLAITARRGERLHALAERLSRKHEVSVQVHEADLTDPGDLGDLDAWSLPTGLYLQSAGPCAVLQIFKQARNGSITLVHVPGTIGDNHVLTADGSRLLIQAPTGCLGSNSLLWFNPATHAEQWLIRAPYSVIGVDVALPFYSRENDL